MEIKKPLDERRDGVTRLKLCDAFRYIIECRIRELAEVKSGFFGPLS